MTIVQRAGTVALALLLSAPAMAAEGPGADQVGTNCPPEAEVTASLVKYITTAWWTPGSMETYSVTAIDGFAFGPIAYGRLQSPGTSYQTCPVRVEFTYALHKKDGSTEVSPFGQGKIFSFSKNPFDEWVFTY
ncbi:MAG: hypothetical protein F9K43_28150 [Bauldia sp.]|nr:MAG: hypothetical protein F9K43_28150 [Bauldia sp.]MBZ0229971.1 hypothetical protein [Bauldia sp.]